MREKAILPPSVQSLAPLAERGKGGDRVGETRRAEAVGVFLALGQLEREKEKKEGEFL